MQESPWQEVLAFQVSDLNLGWFWMLTLKQEARCFQNERIVQKLANLGNCTCSTSPCYILGLSSVHSKDMYKLQTSFSGKKEDRGRPRIWGLWSRGSRSHWNVCWKRRCLIWFWGIKNSVGLLSQCKSRCDYVFARKTSFSRGRLRQKIIGLSNGENSCSYSWF